ncbi:replication protein [Streptococcus sp. NLN64]|uniref:replication protein n=1 Tax=Streptococcus sp. NLN64 TaxID=2822799 RepID=UPI0018C95DD1|nr:replication protein [Streptococcus sp. NLN64]MBG9368262.1 replication protein [Streptococcus sp. NLN64]
MANVNEIQIPSWTEKNYTPTRDYRAKKYTLVVYPQDMPENWRDILRELHWDVVISPLHDKDTNPDGELKKPHHHVIVSAGASWITMKDLAEMGKRLRGVATPQRCSNPKGMVRYFIHADNPEKAQYKRGDIEVYGNFDIERYFKSSISEDREVRQEIVTYIFENEITELADLIDYTIANNELWDDYIASHTLYINQIIRSVRHRGERELKVRVEDLSAEQIQYLEELDRKVEERFPERK